MEEAAQRHVLYTIISSFKSIHLDVCMFNNLCSFHKGKKIHIVDLYAVPTWKDKHVDPVHCLPVIFIYFIFFAVMYSSTEKEIYWEQAQK